MSCRYCLGKGKVWWRAKIKRVTQGEGYKNCTFCGGNGFSINYVDKDVVMKLMNKFLKGHRK